MPFFRINHCIVSIIVRSLHCQVIYPEGKAAPVIFYEAQLLLLEDMKQFLHVCEGHESNHFVALLVSCILIDLSSH